MRPKPKRDWCPGGMERIDFAVKERARKIVHPGRYIERREVPKTEAKIVYARCPECGQRFQTYNIEDCCGPTVGLRRIPRHKATVRPAKVPSLKRIRKMIDGRSGRG